MNRYVIRVDFKNFVFLKKTFAALNKKRQQQHQQQQLKIEHDKSLHYGARLSVLVDANIHIYIIFSRALFTVNFFLLCRKKAFMTLLAFKMYYA